MALQHLLDAKDPVSNLENFADPFTNPASSQFGIEPNASVDLGGPIGQSPSPQPLRDQALRGIARGTAEDLHLRNPRRDLPPSPDGASQRVTDDSDILVELARQPTDQRLLALEQYVFQQHAQELYGLNLRTRTLENKMTAVLGETDSMGMKAKRYHMSALSSPARSMNDDWLNEVSQNSRSLVVNNRPRARW